MKKWVCSVCGYVYEGEQPPVECPVCHVDGSKFIEQKAEKSWAAEHVVGVGKAFGSDVPADVQKEIVDGLRANFEGECSEVGMYLAMSRVAHREGYPEIGLYWEKADLRITLAVGDAGHAEIHADLGALAAEVGLELVEDELLVLLGDAVELRADAELMLGRELHRALDDLELLAGDAADRALEAFGQLIAFINITADGADILLHDKILLKCYFCCFRS